jgi:hypothetical protein
VQLNPAAIAVCSLLSASAWSRHQASRAWVRQLASLERHSIQLELLLGHPQAERSSTHTALVPPSAGSSAVAGLQAVFACMFLLNAACSHCVHHRILSATLPAKGTPQIRNL